MRPPGKETRQGFGGIGKVVVTVGQDHPVQQGKPRKGRVCGKTARNKISPEKLLLVNFNDSARMKPEKIVYNARK